MWCVLTHQSPETYDRLSRLERELFMEAAARIAKRGL